MNFGYPSWCKIWAVLLWGSAGALLKAHESESWMLGSHLHDRLAAWQVASDWDSRYAAEGRDVLDGDSLWQHRLEWTQGPLGLGIWQGQSPEQNYEEWQYSAALTGSLGDLETYVGYTHVRVPSQDAQDDELGAGLSWGEGPLGVELAVDAYHSFAANGAFIEASATREWSAWRGASIAASTIFGMNQGYVADGHNGANHVAVSLGLTQELFENLTFEIHGAWSWALDRNSNLPGDATLKDFLHVGGGFAWSF